MRNFVFLCILVANFFNNVTPTANCYYPSTTIDASCVNDVIDTVSYSKCTKGTVTLYCLGNAEDKNFACCSDNADTTMIGLEIIEAVGSFTPSPIIDEVSTLPPGSVGNCDDLSQNCHLYKNFCGMNLFQVTCPKTCNSCGVTASPSSNVQSKTICKDLSDNCSEMAMYCQDKTYIDMMASVCAATCQKCGDPNTWNNNTMVVQNPKTDKCQNNNKNCNVKTIYCQIFTC